MKVSTLPDSVEWSEVHTGSITETPTGCATSVRSSQDSSLKYELGWI